MRFVVQFHSRTLTVDNRGVVIPFDVRIAVTRSQEAWTIKNTNGLPGKVSGILSL